MKKYRDCIAAAAAIIVMIFAALPIAGIEYEYRSDKDSASLYPDTEIDSLIESLPEDVRRQIHDYTSSENESDRRTALRDKLSPGYWIGAVSDSLRELLFPAVSALVSLLSIIVAGSLAGHIVGITGNGGIRQVYSTVVSLAAAASVAAASENAARSVSVFISNLTSMMNAMLPVMNAVMISSGTPTQMSVSSSALMLYITVTENLTHAVLIPAAGALMALTIVASILKSIDISGFIESAKKALIGTLGVSVTVFSFVLGIQTSLARGADSLTARSVKFAVGSYVPIVGGALSDALTTVGESLSMIRKTTGGIGIVIILLLLLPRLISLILTRLCLTACRLVSDILGAEDTSRIIRGAGSVIEIFCAAAALSAVMFIFAVTLFMNSGLS